MIFLKEGLFLLLAFLDAEFTKHKIDDHGLDVEFNPLVRKLVTLFGLGIGVDLGVCVPTAIFCVAGWYCNDLLMFMLGLRTCLFIFQCLSRSNGN
jgi:hypothetical protein